MFLFLKGWCDSHSNTSYFPSFLLPQAFLNPNCFSLKKPNQNSRENFFKSYLRYVYSIFSLYFLRLCRNILGFYLNWVILKKGWELYFFCEIFFNFLIGLCPIWVVCVCVGQLWHFNMYLGKIQSCSCIAHMLVVWVHIKCLRKCSNDILVLFWTPMSSKLWGLPWLYIFIMFWSLVVCFTHFDPNVLSHALLMHHIGTPPAHLMHTFVHLSCFAYHSC